VKNLNHYQKITLIIFTVIILSEIAIYFPFFTKNPNFEILNYNTSAIEYKISSGSYPLELQVAFFSTERQPHTKTCYIYYDGEYQMAGATRKQARGLVDHLPAELKIRGYEDKIHVVNASGLEHLLLDKQSANESILVITMGAFPDTVYTLDKNLVKPWVEAGGTLFWVGDMFAFYSAEKSKERLDWNAPRHPKAEGRVDFFGAKDVIIPLGWGTTASAQSEYSKALSLLYPYITKGVDVTMAKSMGGKILGKVGEKSTSIASLPLGNGSIVIFGGEIYDEWIVAKDIAQIITSEVLECDNIVDIRKYPLGRNKEVKGELNYSSSIEGSHHIETLIIYVFQTDDEPTFFKNIYLELNGSKSMGGTK
jgi:hypothetical protein